MVTRTAHLRKSTRSLGFLAIILICGLIGILLTGLLPRTLKSARAEDWTINTTTHSSLLTDGEGLKLAVPEGVDVDTVFEYKNKLLLANTKAVNAKGSANYGDFYLSDTSAFVYVKEGDNVYLSDGAGFKPVSPTFTMSVNIPIKDVFTDGEQNMLYKALKDNLINVTFSPYMVQTSPKGINQDINDYCKVAISYFSGRVDEYKTSSDEVTFVSHVSTSSGTIETAYKGVSIDNMACDSGAYVNMTFSDFNIGGYAQNPAMKFGAGIKELGIKVSVKLKDGVVFDTTTDVGASNITIVDKAGNRLQSAESNMLRPGNVVIISTKLKCDTITIGDNSSTSDDWDFYKELFFKPNTSTSNYYEGIDYMVKWNFNSDCFKQIYEFEYFKEGETTATKIDLTLDKATRENMPSGTLAMFQVKSSLLDAPTKIKPYLARYDGKAHSNIGQNDGFAFTIDNYAPQIPYFDTTSDFYRRYFEEKNYFTDEAAYEYATEVADHPELVKGVNISGDLLALMANSLLMKNSDSPLEIFCRITKTDNAEDTVYDDTVNRDSPGMNRLINRYSVSTDSEGRPIWLTEYFSVTVPMFSGSANRLENYYTEGMFRVELYACDAVGNVTKGKTVNILYVDVADYDFSAVIKLGGDDKPADIGVQDFSVKYGIINYYTGKPVYTDIPKFKRGDKVLVKPKFTELGYSKYILTKFATEGGDRHITTEYKYNSDRSMFINANQNEKDPTFVITATYKEGVSREITFTMKNRVTFKVSGNKSAFDGKVKTVTPRAYLGDNQLTTVTINTLYCATKLVNGKWVQDGEFRSASADFPRDAGRYLFRCEVTSDSHYGILVGDNYYLEISKAVPKFNSVVLSPIKYGDSLALREIIKEIYYEDVGGVLVEKTRYIVNPDVLTKYTGYTNAQYINGTYYAGISSDGIPGYFIITSPVSGGSQYTLPNAGKLTLSLVFIPAKCVRDSNGLVAGLLRDSNGMFIKDTNYEEVNVQNVTINVEYSKDVECKVNNELFNPDKVISKIYTGGEFFTDIDVFSTVDGEIVSQKAFLTIWYRNDDVAGSVFMKQAPTAAGNYTIKIVLDDTNPLCNYIGEWYQKISIEPLELTISASNYSYTYQDSKEITNVNAYHYDGENEISHPGLKYVFEYYNYLPGMTNAEMAVPSNLVREDNLFRGLPVNVGKYLIKIIINEKNYTNAEDKFVILTVNAVTSANADYVVRYPALGYNTLDMESHLTYGQPLRYLNISIDRFTVAKYLFQKVNALGNVIKEEREVAGRFVVSPKLYNRVDYPTIADFLREINSYEMQDIGDKEMYMYFVPDSTNFELLYSMCNVRVGKAYAVFDDVRVGNVEYGIAIDSVNKLIVDKKIKFLYEEVNGTKYYTEYLDTTAYDFELLPLYNPLLNAGNHNISLKFVPKGKYADNYALVTQSVPLIVTKKNVSVKLTFPEDTPRDNGQYKFIYYSYVNPKVTFGGGLLLNGNFSYELIDNAGHSEPYADSVLKVGRYNVTYTINNENYSGQSSVIVLIVKDTLMKESSPSISDAVNSVCYDMLMSGVLFLGGTMRSSDGMRVVDGVFELNYSSETKFDKVGINLPYDIRFIPKDKENFEVWYGVMNFEVHKNNLSESMVAELNGYIYGDIDTSMADGSFIKNFSTPIYTNGAKYSNTKLDETYHYLDYKVEILTKPSGKGALYWAGSYPVTVTILDANYSGVKNLTLTVEKRKVLIKIVNDRKEFTNRGQSITAQLYIAVESGSGVTYGELISEVPYQEFYNYKGVKLQNAPIQIGKYTARLYVTSSNYSYYHGEYMVNDFTIRINTGNVTVSNLNQVYSKVKIPGVSMGMNDAVGSLYYRNVATGEIFNEGMPVNAGTYEVFIKFLASDNQGYSEDYLYSKALVIEKCDAEIYANDNNGVITTTYTNKPYNLGLRTDPYNLAYTVEYKRQDSDVFTVKEILDATKNDGYHEISITIDSDNYKGTKILKYYIKPAKITVLSEPSFGDYIYNTTTQPSLTVEGSYRFGYDKYLEGKYEVNLDLIKYLDVGLHNAKYTFIPYENGVRDYNYAPVEGTVSINIAKQEINPDNIYLSSDNKYNVKYNAKPHRVNVIINSTLSNVSDFDGIIYDIGGANNDLFIKVLYDETINPAIEINTYSLSCEIISKNYTGKKIFTEVLSVNYGEPNIRRLPTVKDGYVFRKGDLVPVDILNTDGEAYIEDTDTLISGSYLVVSGQRLNKANINTIEVQFTPADEAHYTARAFLISINVLGTDPMTVSGYWNEGVITSVMPGYGDVKIKISPRTGYQMVYGVALKYLEVVFESVNGNNSALKYQAFGSLEFVDPDKIPQIGEEIELRYIPFGASSDEYNIMTGKARIELQPSENYDWNVDFKGIKGKIHSSDGSILTVTDGLNPIDVISYELYTDGSKTTLFDVNTVWGDINNKQNLYIVIFTRNYQPFEKMITVNVYEEITEGQIFIGKTKKVFDNVELGLSDFGFTSDKVIDEQFITVTITDKDGKMSKGIGVGVYEVEILIDDGVNYGHKKFNFEVTKRDVSTEISLDQYTSRFGATQKPEVVLYQYNLPTVDYKMYFKRAQASDTNYTVNMIEEAGNYNIKVVVDTDNYYGERIFDYIVTPKLVAYVGMEKFSQTYNPNSPNLAPKFTFKQTNSDEIVSIGYIIKYYSDTYTLSEIIPDSVGNYRARIIITDGNFALDTQSGYKEVDFVIEKARVSITQAPTLATNVSDGERYNIKYGQTLNNVVIVGGVGKYGDEVLEGSFRFVQPTLVPVVGANKYFIEFVPNNSNYAHQEMEIEVRVTKGDATVVLDNLYTQYNGQNQSNIVTYTVFPNNVNVRIVFTNSKGQEVAPINAGNYFIKVTSLDPNYKVFVAQSAGDPGQENTNPMLVISKARVQHNSDGSYRVYTPKSLPISCGDNLLKSELSSGNGYGEVYYEGFSRPIDGKFSYVQYALTFKDVGSYTVDYLFVPGSSGVYDQNYETYTGKVNVEVKPALANIYVTDNVLTYGDGFTMPTFRTMPEGLEVRHDITFNAGDIVNARTYNFYAWIVSPNYYREENKIEFSIKVQKRNIDIDFVMPDGELVTQYVTTYGAKLDAKIKLYEWNNTQGKRGYLAKDYITNGIKINESYVMRYQSTSSTGEYDSHNAPTNRGVYTVTVELNNNNYTATRTSYYYVERGVINDVSFDVKLLEQQIYGYVLAPVVTTSPSNVKHYISYQGNNLTMPKDVGSYNITVYFNDDNYEKKQVTALFRINPRQIDIVDIFVSDKVYDGVANLKITGKLKGVLANDEVSLSMTASTFNNRTEVGAHSVNITSYVLKGLHAGNYKVSAPKYNGKINIFNKIIYAPQNSGYVTSATGFNEGTTMQIKEVYTKQNKSNFFTRAMGVRARVFYYNILDNGEETILENPVKVYILIPEEYRNVKFTVEGTGNLAGSSVLFTIEGNYITFHATNSGGVVFSYKEFKFAPMVIAGAILIVIVALVVLLLLNPLHHHSKTEDKQAKKDAVRRIKNGDYWDR